MQISEIYRSIKDFTVLVLNDSSITVYLNAQSANMAQKPVVTIKLGAFNQVGTAMFYEIDEMGIQRTGLNKRFTVTFQAYTDELHRAEDILNKIHNALHSTLEFDFFKGDIAFNNTMLGVSALPTAIGAKNESRAILEVEFYTCQEEQWQVGFIEHVEVHDNLTNTDIIINK